MLKRSNQIPDDVLTSRAQQILNNRGLRPPCQISVSTSNGVISISGKVEHTHQLQTALSAIRGVSGARGFNSSLTVAAIVRDWDKPAEPKQDAPTS